MALITLHAVQAATVNRHHGALHVYQIVLTQLFGVPFQSKIVPHWVRFAQTELLHTTSTLVRWATAAHAPSPRAVTARSISCTSAA
jgi:hypothetical protein